MELPDFIDQLEQAITNAGSDKLWKRTIGELELWFSPMTLPASLKVNESLTNVDLGVNVVIESKRITLANSIVGLNGMDLRKWRGGQAVFPVTNKEGKKVKVRLEEYVYDRMSTWGGQFVDDVFMVYADLLESHQKENLKDIRFENAKDPRLELMELEARAAELRKQLAMPAMVEVGSPAAPAEETPTDQAADAEAPADGEAKEEKDADFDPFNPVRHDGVPAHVQEAEAAVTRQRAAHRAPAPPQESVARTVPSMNLPELVTDGPKTSEDELFQTPQVAQAPRQAPQIPLPPVRAEEVLEAPAERKIVAPPRIDSVPQNTNPRFSRLGR